VSQNPGRAGKNATYLRLEKPRFLFQEGWGRLHRAYWRLCGARWHLHRRPDDGWLLARHEGRFHYCPLRQWGWGRGFPPIRGGPLPVALLLVRRQVRQRRWRGETLLLALPVLFVVLVEALLPPDPPLLRESRPVPLSLLCCAAGGMGSRRRRVRSGGMDVHRLWAMTVRTNEKRETRSKKQRKGCAHRPGVREHHERP
jgi:hypothetical protein